MLVFFDDILIYSKTYEEHLKQLEMVLQLLQNHCLFAKKSKCEFGTQQIHYLGHVINPDGVSTDQDKIDCMLKWSTPTTIKGLRGFLGLTGYYRRFIRNYGVMSRPLTDLLKKGKFGWNDQAAQAFQQLKQAMSQAPVLAMPNFEEPFVLETDASYGGIGAVLMQQNRPIAFLSKAISAKHLGYSTYEKELMAVVFAANKWRHYLLGNKILIKTDHHSLRYLLDQRITTINQQKWITKLMGLDYEISYKKGKENVVADSLSRKMESAEEFIPESAGLQKVCTTSSALPYVNYSNSIMDS